MALNLGKIHGNAAEIAPNQGQILMVHILHTHLRDGYIYESPEYP